LFLATKKCRIYAAFGVSQTPNHIIIQGGDRMKKNKISATDLERQIYEKEEVRVVIRAHEDTEFIAYPYDRKAATTTSATDWYNTRLKPLLGNDVDAVIIDGHGNIPHGRTKMDTIRNSYVEK
jgi:hypothetical protein